MEIDKNTYNKIKLKEILIFINSIIKITTIKEHIIKVIIIIKKTIIKIKNQDS